MRPALKRAHKRNARRLHKGILRLRGVYIKLGQVISVLGSFLPVAFIEALEGLQDQVPERKYREIRRAFIRDRKESPEAVFEEFSTVPIAAASLAQVHKAKTKQGEIVAVKVLYPDIDRLIKIDLKVIRWVFWVYSKLRPVMPNFQSILRQLEDVLSRETDLVLEAENIEKLAAKFRGQDQFVFPTVVEALSSRRILVMEYVEGYKITDVDALRAAQIDPTAVAEILVKSYYQQFLVDGLYHADPHPGNFLVQPGPKLVFLDFGAVEPVRENLREGMIEFLFGLITKDDDKAIDGIETMGFVAPDGNRELLEKTVRHYFVKFYSLRIKDYSKIDVTQFVSPEEFRHLRQNLRELTLAIKYPDGYFYIERSLLLLFGVVAILDPTVNAIELGFPYANEFILNRRMQQDAKAANQKPEVQSEMANN